MARETKSQLSSTRINTPLHDFIQEQAAKHPKGLTGVVEEYLTFGAISDGFKPRDVIGRRFEAFAQNLTAQLVKDLKEKGLLVEAQE
jgi:hypothetical protein